MGTGVSYVISFLCLPNYPIVFMWISDLNLKLAILERRFMIFILTWPTLGLRVEERLEGDIWISPELN